MEYVLVVKTEKLSQFISGRTGLITESGAEMLDIIFATRVFDVGIYYNLGGYKDKICSMLRLGDTLTNVYETNRSVAEQKLEGINELFRESTAD